MMSSPPSQFNYPLPKVGITASQVGTRISVSIGGSFQQDIWVELNNESPYILSIFSAQGILLNSLQPQIVDIAQIPSGDSLFIIVPNILIPQSSPSSEVDINVYPFEKPEGAYPFPLNRQSAPITSAALVGFCAVFLWSVAAAQGAAMSLFNPSNSTKIATIVYAQAIANFASGTPTLNLFGSNNSSDHAFTTTVTIAPLDLILVPATSLMSVTAQNNPAGFGESFTLAAQNGFLSGQSVELLKFPVQCQVAAKSRITLSIGGLPGTGGFGFYYLVWTEQ